MVEASSRNAVVTGAAGGMGRAITQPGLTRTSIILTRYRGDREKEKDYFDQFKMALDPDDIARSIAFALDQPPHVQIAEMMILPVNRY
jgi:3-hydroxy acid dehydrogenase/malonic semialdehyde reductase